MEATRTRGGPWRILAVALAVLMAVAAWRVGTDWGGPRVIDGGVAQDSHEGAPAGRLAATPESGPRAPAREEAPVAEREAASDRKGKRAVPETPSNAWSVVYDDGRGKARAWLGDEILVASAEGHGWTPPPASGGTIEPVKGGVVVRFAGATRAELREKAAAFALAPGVREVRPVFYPSPEALAQREARLRMALTREIVVRLAPTVDHAVFAASAGVEFARTLSYSPDTCVVQAPDAFGALEVCALLAGTSGCVEATPQFARQLESKEAPNDTSYGLQWHLPGGGEGIDAENVWDFAGNTRLGNGVVVAVVDDGLQTNHPDLIGNFQAGLLNLDINAEPDDNDPSPVGASDSHGTAVAGAVAAFGNNGVGVCGVAPRSTLVGIRLIAAATTDLDAATAMSHGNAGIHVKNNSLGPPDDVGGLFASGTLFRDAVRDGVTNGRGGLGTVYVWAGGNGTTGKDDVNYDGNANNRNVIAVSSAATDGTEQFEPGAAILVCAPGQNILTTDRTGADGYDPGDYVSESGTSLAAPLVSGTVALMLEANPALTWRDVMWILVDTADTNDPTDPDWHTNGSGRTVSHKFGHGRINAAAAVAAAPGFVSVGGAAEEKVQTGSAAPGAWIPDSPSAGVSSTIAIPYSMTVEHVEVDFVSNHAYADDLTITLRSPSGTDSILARQYLSNPIPAQIRDYSTGWTFMTTLAWGEEGQGDWTLTVKDDSPGVVGKFTSWTLRVYGFDATAPQIANITTATPDGVYGPGQSVNVAVNFSEAVTLAGGTLNVALDSGAVLSLAAFGPALSATGTYTVGLGENSLDLAAISPLTLSPGATLRDWAGNDAVLAITPGTNLSDLHDIRVFDAAPGAPAGLAAREGNGKVVLTWTANGDADLSGYNVYRGTSPGGPYAGPLNGPAVVATTYTDTTAINGTIYTYVVRAVDLGGQESLDSGEISITPSAVPQRPTGVAAAGGDGQVALSWTSSTSLDVTGVIVYRGTGTGGPYAPLNPGAPAPGTGYVDASAANGTPYFYVLHSVNTSLNESLGSTEVSATPISTPLAPISLAAAVGNQEVQLSWTASASAGVAGYIVYRATAAGGPYAALNAGSPTALTSYTDSPLTNYVAYYHVVSAVNTNGTIGSASSEVRSVPYSGIPSSPSSATPTAGNSQVSLTWSPSASSGVTGYYVLRGATSGGPYTALNPSSPTTSTSYVDTAVTNGVAYFYVVQAVDAAGQVSTTSGEIVALPSSSGGMVMTVVAAGQVQVSGGALLVTSGNLSGVGVTIPSGALTQAQNITISEVSQSLPTGPGRFRSGPVIDFSPTGIAFATAVTLRLPFRAEDQGLDLRPCRFDFLTNTWRELPIASWNSVDRYVEVSVTSFSVYALGVAPIASVAGVASGSGGGGVGGGDGGDSGGSGSGSGGGGVDRGHSSGGGCWVITAGAVPIPGLAFAGLLSAILAIVRLVRRSA